MIAQAVQRPDTLFDIVLPNKIYSTGVPENKLQKKVATSSFFYRTTCQSCGQCITDTMPCPYCNKESVITKEEPTKVKVNYATMTRIGAVYKSKTRPGVEHVLRCDKSKKFVSCSCEGFYYRKTCKHRDAWEIKHPN